MRRNLETILASISLQCFLCIYPEICRSFQLGWPGQQRNESGTSEWVDRDEHGANVSVNLGVGPSFLEILVDALVADSGEQRHIGDPDLLLLEALLPIRLAED
jgi:hypothetical protein